MIKASTEAILKSLENEVAALKAAQELSTLTLPVVSHTGEAQTTQNFLDVKYSYDGADYTYTMIAEERIEVTFDTARGSDTIAVLEVSANRPTASPRVQRVKYAGGARWIVTGRPYIDTSSGSQVWQSTTYNFAVRSMLDGTLTIREMSS